LTVPGTKYHVVVNGDGLTTDVNATIMFERLFRAAFAVMVQVRTAFADKGYDAEAHHDLCRSYCTELRLHKPGQPHGSGLGKRLWPVKHANTWPMQNKRLGLRYDRLGFIVEAVL
jgi:transposase